MEGRMRILIAEDDPLSRLALSDFLIDLGYEVASCENGEKAFEKFVDQPFDMVITDIKMPKMDGIELLKKIRSLKSGEKTDILLATAYGEFNLAIDALRAGAKDYLLKPINIEQILPHLIRVSEQKKIEGRNFPNKLGKLVVKEQDTTHFIDLKDIIMISREDRKSIIYTHGGIYKTYATLQKLENSLSKDRFFRSHKSFIININLISNIVYLGKNISKIRFKDIKVNALITSEKLEDLRARCLI